MSNINIQVIGKHFTALDKLFDGNTYRYLVSQGSSRSGKSYQIAVYLILRAIQNAETIVVCRYEQTTVKNTIWQDFIHVVNTLEFDNNEININRSELVLTFPQSKGRIKFTGLNDPSKIKGLASDHAFVDEALDCNLEAINQLDQRCRGKIIFAFNPSLTSHYIMDTVRYLPKTLYLHSTHYDNSFISADQRAKLISYDPTIEVNVVNGTADEYMHKVYNLGEPCGRQGRIFTKFLLHNNYQPPTIGNVIYGLDFGSVHPMALVKVNCYDDQYWCETLLYESDLIINSNDDNDDKTLIKRLEQLQIDKTAMIICDNARPEAINALKRAGYNAHPCIKGAGSVINRIELVQSCIINIPKGDKLQLESEQYVWQTDATGNPVSPAKPIKKYDDALDALGYAISALVKNPTHNTTGVSRGSQIIANRNKSLLRSRR